MLDETVYSVEAAQDLPAQQANEGHVSQDELDLPAGDPRPPQECLEANPQDSPAPMLGPGLEPSNMDGDTESHA